jgi:hypothetical protein
MAEQVVAMRESGHHGMIVGCAVLAYLTVTNTFAVLRLLPMSDRDKAGPAPSDRGARASTGRTEGAVHPE